MKFLPLLLAVLLCASCGPAKRARAMKESVAAAKTGDWATAHQAALACQDPQDDDPGALAILALTQFQEDQSTLPSSLELMEKAVALTPERYDLLYLKGWLLMKGERYREALDSLQQAYDLHMNQENNSHVPENVEGAIQYCLALCNTRLHKNDEAISYLEKAMRHSDYSNNPALINNHAVLLMRKKQYDKASTLLNRIFKAPPKDPEYGVNMAVCMDFLSDPKINPKGASSYKKQLPGWYAYALKRTTAALTDNSLSTKKKQELQSLRRQLEARQKKIVSAK